MKCLLALRVPLSASTALACLLALSPVPRCPAQTVAAPVPPVSVSLDEAIKRAEANEPVLATANAESRAAQADRWIAKAAMLPTVTYHNQVLYTQPNGLDNQAGQGVGAQPSPRFIANNAVREYASQALINETIGLQQAAAVAHAEAAAVRAEAEAEIARRGLVAAVVQLYYTLLTADRKVTVSHRAADEADSFVTLTRDREQAREAAHADVVRAQLEQQQRHRDMTEAELSAEKARLELGVLLFPDPRTPYSLDAPEAPPPLASKADVQAAAARNNPELRSALAALRESDADVRSARAAYLPDLGLNVAYGIDAPQVAANGPDGARNLGYSASVTLDIPVWDWLSTGHKVKQSEIRREAVKVALTAAQRRTVADLEEAYSEAAAARDFLASLDESVSTARESLRLTRLRYTGGEATALEVVDAQNALTTAEDAREDGDLRYQTALAALQTLTGTL